MNNAQTEAVAFAVVIAWVSYMLGKNRNTAPKAALEAAYDPLAWLGSWAQL